MSISAVRENGTQDRNEVHLKENNENDIFCIYAYVAYEILTTICIYMFSFLYIISKYGLVDLCVFIYIYICKVERKKINQTKVYWLSLDEGVMGYFKFSLVYSAVSFQLSKVNMIRKIK